MSEGSKPDLKIVKNIELPKESRTYWNTVGKDKEFFPKKPRPNSIPETMIKETKEGSKTIVVKEPEDEWWINSKKDKYCFWSYIKRNSHPDGKMEPLLQSEIAELFGCSSTKIHFILKEALENLIESDYLQGLEDLFEESQQDTEDLTNQSSLFNDIDPGDFDDSDY